MDVMTFSIAIIAAVVLGGVVEYIRYRRKANN